MVRWKSKGCSRCGGSTFIEHDFDGWYEQCMLCSHRLELKDANNFPQTDELKDTEKQKLSLLE